MKQIIIFTDLDGTLIDHDTYGFNEALPVLEQLRAMSIPVIICSSKTRAEIETYRQRMGIPDPFIVENGGAIFIPRNTLNLRGVSSIEKEQYNVVESGVPYSDLCKTWKEIKNEKSFLMRGFSEMTIEEIAASTGLPLEEARLAAKREYSEPFSFSDTPAQFRLLTTILKEKGLRVTRGGRFCHMIGLNDKGKAVRVLKRIYAGTYPDKKIWTAGLGDSPNDIPMLRPVDTPIVIWEKTGEGERIEGTDSTVYSDKAGPGGWAETVQSILLQE